MVPIDDRAMGVPMAVAAETWPVPAYAEADSDEAADLIEIEIGDLDEVERLLGDANDGVAEMARHCDRHGQRLARAIHDVHVDIADKLGVAAPRLGRVVWYPEAHGLSPERRQAIALHRDLLLMEYERIAQADPRFGGAVANMRADLAEILRLSGLSEGAR
jgi:hypothetical protein